MAFVQSCENPNVNMEMYNRFQNNINNASNIIENNKEAMRRMVTKLTNSLPKSDLSRQAKDRTLSSIQDNYHSFIHLRNYLANEFPTEYQKFIEKECSLTDGEYMLRACLSYITNNKIIPCANIIQSIVMYLPAEKRWEIIIALQECFNSLK